MSEGEQKAPEGSEYPAFPETGPGPGRFEAWRRQPLPADVYTPWGWKEVVLFCLVAFALLFLLTNVMALGAMYWLHLGQAGVMKFAETSATFLSIRIAIWYVMVIAYLFATLALTRHVPFWRTIGWRDFPEGNTPRAPKYGAGVIAGMALAVLVGLGSKAFPTKGTLPIEQLFHSRQGVLWLMGVGILLAPAVEETIFRGYLYPVLARSLGVGGGVLVTGFLFGMMHAEQLWGGWGQIGLMVVVGIVLTYARARAGTVLASWLLHLGYNTFLFAGLFVSTSGLHHLPPAP